MDKEKPELSLISLEDLLREAEKRCPSFICAFTLQDPENKHDDMFWFGKGPRAKAIQLSADLKNDILNNWNGELKTLQRINAEGGV